ncbi:MAG: SusC/RagA family TonB-linked outer membrane protein [Dysgonomonas sp.]
MKRWLFLLFLFTILPITAALAQQTIKGVVVDETKEPLIGVSVSVKGTTTGVMTDLDGKYSITVPTGSALTFDYLGMETQEIKTTPTTTTLDVTMHPVAQQIEEVVVTAMGVVQEKKRMNFAVQSLNSDDLLASKPTNFIQGLQGKVAGLNITQSGGSPNASSHLVIRAISSISTGSNNEPLFVIDGMNMSAGSGGMANINPADIENVTILKGAAASALYGQEGANGVIMVTTKSAKKGKITVNFNNSFQIDNVYRVPEIQNKWLPGANGVKTSLPTTGGWGPINALGEKTYKNAEDFFETALMHKHDLSVSAGGEKFTAFASLNYLSQEGVIPKDKLDRVGMMLKTTFDISPTLSMTFMANINNSKFRDANGNETGSKTSSYLARAYSWPINDDMNNYKNPDGSIRWLYLDPTIEKSPLNPYWNRYEDTQEREATNNILQATANWKVIKGLDLSGRIGYEHGNSSWEEYTTPRFSRDLVRQNAINHGSWDPIKEPTKDPSENLSPSYYGTAYLRNTRSSTFTAQAIARYKYTFNDDYTIEAMAGTEMKLSKGLTTYLGGTDFIIPDFYSISNVRNSVTGYQKDNYASHSKRRLYGFFGELRFDYKGIASVSVTGRNDHSSTLPTNKNSYFYPSVTGGFVFSELFNISNDIFSYGKVRGNWARVGKDAPANQYGQKFSYKPTHPDPGYGVLPTLAVAKELKPEMTDSWEIGADLRFFNSKTRLDIAYYSTKVNDQIITVRTSPTAGTILQTLNGGSIENKGMEISLDQDILKNKDFKWTGNVIFSYNRSKVTDLPMGQIQVANTAGRIGNDIQPTAYLGHSTTSIIGRDYERTPDGKIIVNEDGTPRVAADPNILIGDREPDFRMGVGSNFQWKDLSLSFLFDIRKGGDVANGTAISLYGNGMHKRLEDYRDRQIVIDGVVLQPDGTYKQNTTPVTFNQQFISNYFTQASSNFIEDGSYVRLSHVTIGYDLSKYVRKTPIKGLNVSLTGRNLFLWTKYSGSDPQVNTGSNGGSGSMGMDDLVVPNTRSFNITLNATF